VPIFDPLAIIRPTLWTFCSSQREYPDDHFFTTSKVPCLFRQSILYLRSEPRMTMNIGPPIKQFVLLHHLTCAAEMPVFGRAKVAIPPPPRQAKAKLQCCGSPLPLATAVVIFPQRSNHTTSNGALNLDFIFNAQYKSVGNVLAAVISFLAFFLAAAFASAVALINFRMCFQNRSKSIF